MVVTCRNSQLQWIHQLALCRTCRRVSICALITTLFVEREYSWETNSASFWTYMLPLPASFRVRQPSPFSRTTRKSYRSTRDVLLTRARVTNLGLLLLVSFAALSFLVNLIFYLSSGGESEPQNSKLRASPHTRPSSILSTIQRDPTLSSLSHLIIVPGHAIWKGTDSARILDEDDWVLESYQHGGGRVAAFYNHIVAG